MIKVLGRRNSANVQKVMWVLGELGLDYERENIAGSFGFPDDYPNPVNVVPTIVDGDITVWESNACVRYVARQYGVGSLWPEDPKTLAQADQWMEWQRSGFSDAFFPLFANKIRMDVDNESLADKIIAIGEQYKILDAHLADNDYVAGSSLTIGDIPLGAVTYRYKTLDIDRPSTPNVDAWYGRLTERPAYQYHVMIPYGTNAAEWAEEEQKNAGIQ